MPDQENNCPERPDPASLLARIVIKGRLVLESPLRIGTGAEGAGSQEADIYVLKDEQGRPFIPGSSLAGVLRAGMQAGGQADLVRLFFGDARTERDPRAEKLQSSLDVRDIMLNDTEIVLRDGVSLLQGTGTARATGKFNYEAVERGANGKLELVLTLRRRHEAQYEPVLAAATELAQLLRQGIQLGSLTSSGFGRAACPDLHLYVYDFRQSGAAVAAWLLGQEYGEVLLAEQPEKLLPCGAFRVEAQFRLSTPLLVRQYTEEKLQESVAGLTITARPLDSRDDYVLPGTSLKGVLRHRAARILQKLDWPQDTAAAWLSDLMGTAGGPDGAGAKKSRLLVAESYIKKEHIQVAAQPRTRIDRFTGGGIRGMLFGERALWQKGEEPVLELSYELRDPKPGEIGLALLLLKDMWLGDVALGGDKSIGRGRLQGAQAMLTYRSPEGETLAWQIDADGMLHGAQARQLEAWVEELAEARR